MKNPADIARERIAELKAQIAELQRFLEMYEELAAVVEAAPLSAMPAEGRKNYNADTWGNGKETIRAIELSTGPVDNLARPDDGGGNERRPGEVAAMMESIIRSVGRPMQRGELVLAFEARDFEIPAKDKARYLGTIAWRNKSKFVNIEGQGYWLRDTSLPRGQRLLQLNEIDDDIPDNLKGDSEDFF